MKKQDKDLGAAKKETPKTIEIGSQTEQMKMLTELYKKAQEQIRSETYIPVKKRIAQNLYIPSNYVECKLCKRPAPEGHTYCYPCVWRTRWADHILDDSENERRRKRSHLTNLVSIDWDAPEGKFRGSGKELYTTHLNDCTCKDFALGHKKRPCKHIYRLATELGLYAPEAFKDDEDDYIMHIHEEGFDVDEYFKQLRGINSDENNYS